MKLASGVVVIVWHAVASVKLPSRNWILNHQWRFRWCGHHYKITWTLREPFKPQCVFFRGKKDIHLFCVFVYSQASMFVVNFECQELILTNFWFFFFRFPILTVKLEYFAICYEMAKFSCKKVKKRFKLGMAMQWLEYAFLSRWSFFLSLLLNAAISHLHP